MASGHGLDPPIRRAPAWKNCGMCHCCREETVRGEGSRPRGSVRPTVSAQVLGMEILETRAGRSNYTFSWLLFFLYSKWFCPCHAVLGVGKILPSSHSPPPPVDWPEFAADSERRSCTVCRPRGSFFFFALGSDRPKGTVNFYTAFSELPLTEHCAICTVVRPTTSSRDVWVALPFYTLCRWMLALQPLRCA